MRVAFIALLCFIGSSQAFAQSMSLAPDSTRVSDSTRMLDSAYRARRAMLNQWMRDHHENTHPQEDFISLYFSYGSYIQIAPKDLNQLFSARTLRPDPIGDRNQYATATYAFLFGAQAQLSKTWGIYFEYGFVNKGSNLQIDDSLFGLQGSIEDLQLTEHTLVVGGMFVIYNSPFYRLRANGGFGGVFALVSETESNSKNVQDATRASTAMGYSVNFDLENDLRVAEHLSCTIDLLTRSVTTGKLKTSGGKTIDAPFGKNPNPISIAPTASNVVYGLAAGLVYYF